MATYNYNGHKQLQRPHTITTATNNYNGHIQLQRPHTSSIIAALENVFKFVKIP